MSEIHTADLAGILRSQYRSWFAVLSQEGTGDLNTILAHEWAYTNYDGLVRDKATYMANVGSDEPVTLVGPYDLTVREYGPIALVVGGYHVATKDSDDVHLRFTSAWVWRDGRWQCLVHHNCLLTSA